MNPGNTLTCWAPGSQEEAVARDISQTITAKELKILNGTRYRAIRYAIHYQMNRM